MSRPPFSVETAVRRRYAAGAAVRESALCCPVEYRPEYLAAIPKEVIERDYGCGDPSRHVRSGETVLDLGSGTGKVCFIAAQVTGRSGRVIGVDMTDEMLAIARRSAPVVAERIGFSNVEFRKGRIQDLALDLEALDRTLAEHSVGSVSDWLDLEARIADLRANAPMIEDGSIDVVISNCVLNLVSASERRQLFAEIFRVLRPGGRAVISDIVSDRDVPDELARDPELWSGCISGAFREDAFLEIFSCAGFHGVAMLSRDDAPWKTVEGIEFRSATVRAWKAAEAASEGGEVIYRGPFRSVEDDSGSVFRRGRRAAVSAHAMARFSQPPYDGDFLRVGGRNGAASSAGCCDDPGASSCC